MIKIRIRETCSKDGGCMIAYATNRVKHSSYYTESFVEIETLQTWEVANSFSVHLYAMSTFNTQL